jgi:DNA-binding transcriptional MerR regulator
MADRAHLSIGEVLSLLQDEFPDITISKIRFLESQGLLDPERTPSGYRKFYEPDIERLRWILQQQRENFLPLRVIKDRLDVRGGETNGESAVAVAKAPAVGHVVVPSELADAEPPALTREEPEREVYEPPPRPVYEPPAPAEARSAARSSRAFDPGVSAASLTGEELMAATGLSEKALAELERFGLVAGRAMGRDTIYDEEALTVGRLCAAFARFGVEPRHLRMYKVAAEREASFFEQVVLPLLKQRNPDARRQAVENLGELAALGDSLRAAMLRGALKGYTTPH